MSHWKTIEFYSPVFKVNVWYSFLTKTGNQQATEDIQ